MEAIQKAVDERNIFGGTVTLGKAITYLKGATMNYMKNVEDMNRQLQESYQSGSVNPAVTQAIIGAVPMGAEIKGLYHGSPYKFSKFANEKIGTGEGAQAFGYGHYFSESPGIARDYARRLTPKGEQWTGNIVIGGQSIPWEDAVRKYYPDGDSVLKGFQKGMKNMNKNQIHDFIADDIIPEIRSSVGLNRKNWGRIKPEYIKMNPNVYETTVNKGKPSSADVFLEWDKAPDPSMRQKLIKQYINEGHDINKLIKAEGNIDLPTKWTNEQKLNYLFDAKGSTVYELLARAMNKVTPQGFEIGSGVKGASDLLQRAGITGIKYPSGTLSGIKGSPYSNYVIFNPEDITIEAVK